MLFKIKVLSLQCETTFITLQQLSNYQTYGKNQLFFKQKVS